MKKPLFLGICLCIGSAVFFSSCKKDGHPVPLSSVKALDSFSVKRADGTSFNASDILVTVTTGDTILVSVPPFTDLTMLTPEFSFQGKSVSPLSGVTLNLSAPVIFTVTAEDGSQLKYTVIVKTRGAVLYGTNDNRFFALDGGTGNQAWKDSLPGEFQYCVPQLIDSIVYVASTSGVVYGLDPASGTVKWQFQAGGPVASTPTIDNGTIYFGSDDHNFYAVDLTSASVKWTFPTSEPIDTRPLISNGTVYFASGDGNLYAVDESSGTAKWQLYIGVVAIAAPQLSNGLIYIGSRSDSLYAVDATTGNQVWSAKADGFSLENSNPTVDSGVVYVGAESGSLFAFNAATGAQEWMSLNQASVYDQPFIYNNTVYVTADDGTLDAVNAQTGAPVWKYPMIYANGSGPLVADGTLYVGGGGSRYFYAFDPASGNIKWTFYTGNALVLSFRPLYIEGN
jgi:eukaryotic-like serine/threonine-protein kinase